MTKLFMTIVLFAITIASISQSEFGCTDPTASNYSNLASIDDGSCCYNLSLTLSSTQEGSIGIWNNDAEFEVQEGTFPGTNQFCLEFSCITISIINDSEVSATYTLVSSAGENADIIVDPYSATYWTWSSSEGLTQNCSDPWACNYNPTAECGSIYTCTYECWGCTNPEAINFNPDANIDNGTCCLIGPGCMDPEACNYDANAQCDFDVICTYDCYGCMDEAAPNYNPEATMDDGSCCTNENYASFISNATGFFQLHSSFVTVYLHVTEPNVPYYLCIPDGCYFFSYYAFGEGSTLTSYTLTRNGEILLEANQIAPYSSQQLSVNPTYGCADSDACNYDSSITCSDPNLCNYDCYGCMDPTALNYNPESTMDDNLCCYAEYTIIAEQSAYVTACWVTNIILETGTYPDLNTFCIPDDCIKITYQEDTYSPTEITIVDQNGEIVFTGMTDENGFIEMGFDMNGIVGCGNENACNYNPEVTCNVESSCNYDCYGCMDPTANNYDPEATIASLCCFNSWIIVEVSEQCVFQIKYTNSSGMLTSSNGIYPNQNTFCLDTENCFDITFFPDDLQDISYSIFDSNGNLIGSGIANYSDASVVSLSGNLISGCNDVLACNYDPLVNCADWGTCNYDCNGCTDPDAYNYDESATIDDGSCCFDGWVYFEISEPAYITVQSGNNQDEQAFDYPETTGFCAENGCYYVQFYSLSDNAVSFSIFDQLGNVLDNGFVAEYTYYHGGLSLFGEVYGCMDPSACDFNPEATCSGDCEYYCGGCTDINALNFSSEAQFDDGSCFYTIEAPNITFQTELDELLDVFYIIVNMQSIGNGAPYIMSNSYDQTLNMIEELNSYYLGPFPCNVPVNVSLHSTEYGFIEYFVSDPIQVNCTNSIDQVSTQTELKIFPNPSTGQFTIQGIADGNWQMNVTDITGRIVSSSFITINNAQYIANLGSLAVGNYQLTFSNNTQSITSRVAIQR